MKKVGIYVIESPTHKIYVGQSRNIQKRWVSYKRLDCKDQPKIYRSLKKHGVDAHEFTTVQHFTQSVTQEILNKYECDYIELFKSSGFEMLNVRGGGHNGSWSDEMKKALSEKKKGVPRPYYKGELNPYYGKKHSEDVRKKMSISGKDNKIGSKNGRARKVYQYDLNMNLIKEWDTITNASKELKLFRQAISDCLNGRIKTSGKFIWKYKNEN